MRRVAGFCICFAIFALSVASTAPVPTQFGQPGLVRLDPVGGPGGNSFEHVCAPGRVLFGIAGYAGVWIDTVQAVCARPREDGRGVSDPMPEGPVFGGSRPVNKGANCPSGIVTGLALTANQDKPFLGSIALRCGEGSADAVLRATGLLASPATRQECPAGSVAVGIRGRAGQFVDALGLVCGPRPGPWSGLSSLLGKEASFQSFNYPDRYIRHRGFLGYTEPVRDDLGRRDATFKVVRGLAGKCASLESQNHPGHFLRHEGSRVKLAKHSGDRLFEQDATFCIADGLAGAGGISFESLNYPSHFVRHRNSELWLDRYDGSDLFRKDATFQVTQAGGGMIVR